jgi:hypothetical protein
MSIQICSFRASSLAQMETTNLFGSESSSADEAEEELTPSPRKRVRVLSSDDEKEAPLRATLERLGRPKADLIRVKQCAVRKEGLRLLRSSAADKVFVQQQSRASRARTRSERDAQTGPESGSSNSAEKDLSAATGSSKLSTSGSQLSVSEDEGADKSNDTKPVVEKAEKEKPSHPAPPPAFKRPVKTARLTRAATEVADQQKSVASVSSSKDRSSEEEEEAADHSAKRFNRFSSEKRTAAGQKGPAARSSAGSMSDVKPDAELVAKKQDPSGSSSLLDHLLSGQVKLLEKGQHAAAAAGQLSKGSGRQAVAGAAAAPVVRYRGEELGHLQQGCGKLEDYRGPAPGTGSLNYRVWNIWDKARPASNLRMLVRCKVTLFLPAPHFRFHFILHLPSL